MGRTSYPRANGRKQYALKGQKLLAQGEWNTSSTP